MFFKLVNKEPVKCNMLEWEEWMKDADRVVALDLVSSSQGVITISTIFSGVSFETSELGKPLTVFETYVFGGPIKSFTQYYSTWEEAENGHKELVAELRQKFEEP